MQKTEKRDVTGTNERWELINGVAYAMSAASTIRHQDVVSLSMIRFASCSLISLCLGTGSDAPDTGL